MLVGCRGLQMRGQVVLGVRACRDLCMIHQEYLMDPRGFSESWPCVKLSYQQAKVMYLKLVYLGTVRGQMTASIHGSARVKIYFHANAAQYNGDGSLICTEGTSGLLMAV